MRLVFVLGLLVWQIGCETVEDNSAADVAEGAVDMGGDISAALPVGDAFIPAADSDMPEMDANLPVEDAEVPAEDARRPIGDAESSIEDADSPIEDANRPIGDASPPPVMDADLLGDAMAPPVDDAARPLSDAAHPEADAGVAPRNAGFVEILPPQTEGGELRPFLMGSPENEAGRHDDETQRQVYLTHAYFMKITEVTKADWALHFRPELYAPVPELDCPDCPVAGVGFFNALAYANRMSEVAGLPQCYRLDRCNDAAPGSPEYACTRVTVTSGSGEPRDCPGYRLPTEAEWEYAARAGANGALPNGDPDLEGAPLLELYREMKTRACARIGQEEIGGPAYAGINDCAHYEARRVAGDCDDGPCLNPVEAVGERNNFGLSDMLGNVSEWVWDGYERPTVGTQIDPSGPETAIQRVVRGGSYRTNRSHIRLAFRSMALPNAIRAPAFHDGIGFRLVRTDHQQVWALPEGVMEEAEPAPPGGGDDACRPVRRHVKNVYISGADYFPDAPDVGEGDALQAGDLRVGGIPVPESADDGLSTNAPAGSAVAKAAAINEIFLSTGVYAVAEQTQALGRQGPVRRVVLDTDNHLVVNGEIIAGIEVLDADAAPGPVDDDPEDARRIARYEPTGAGIPQGDDEALQADDVIINGVPIRITTDDDDDVSIEFAASSAVAKTVAINDATERTGVVAIVLPAAVAGTANISAVELDSTNTLYINGQAFCDFRVSNGDAGGPVNDDPLASALAARLESAGSIRVGEGQALNPGDVHLNGIPVPATQDADDPASIIYGGASAIAKAAAINRIREQTSVQANPLPTVVRGRAAVQAMTLDSTNILIINGEMFCDVTINDNDAGGPESDRPEDSRRRAQMTSAFGIEQGVRQSLLDEDIFLNGIPIRPTLRADDPFSTQFGASSAIAKAAAINESIAFSGVSATVLGTTVVGSADIQAVNLDEENMLVINGTNITGIRIEDNDAGEPENLRTLINASSPLTGVRASLNNNRRLQLDAADGRNIVVTSVGNATRLGLTVVPGTLVEGGRIRIESNSAIMLDGNAVTKLGDLGGPGAFMACAVRADGEDNLRSVINAATRFTGVNARVDEEGRLELTAEDGRNIELMVVGVATRTGLSAAPGQSVYGGRLYLESPNTIRLSGRSLSKLGDLGGAGTTLACPVRRDGTDNLRSAINARSRLTGVVADLNDRGRVRLTTPDGRNIVYSVLGNANRTGLSARFGSAVVGGRIRLESAETAFLSSPNNQLRKIGIDDARLLIPRVRADGSDNLRSLINAATDRTGVTAQLNAANELVLVATDGRNIEIRVTGQAINVGYPAGLSLHTAPITLVSESSFTLETTPEGATRIGFGDTDHLHGTTNLTSRDYLICDAESTFVEAQLSCEALGGQLVGLSSADESHWLSAVRVPPDGAWIGHHNRGGGWQRVDGLPYGVRLLENDAIAVEGCALLNPPSATWLSSDCAEAHPFVCAL